MEEFNSTNFLGKQYKKVTIGSFVQIVPSCDSIFSIRTWKQIKKLHLIYKVIIAHWLEIIIHVCM